MRSITINRGWLVPMIALGVVLMALTFWASTSFTAQAAESKVGGLSLADNAFLIGGVSEETAGWNTIMEGTIQTSQWEDLVMDVSLECGLITNTKVKSQKGKVDTSTAEAGVMVRILIDGETADQKYAMPGREDDYSGGIIFCKRIQEQIAKFGGILESCTDLNGDGSITLDECEFKDEELELMLDTMGAHSFNFFATDFDQGDHTIEVQAKLWASNDDSDPLWEDRTSASIGYGSVAINEVKFVKGYTP